MTPEQIAEVQALRDERVAHVNGLAHHDRLIEARDQQIAARAAENTRLAGEVERLKAELPQCNGLCLRGSDVIDIPHRVTGDPIARPHRSCPLHGDLEQVAWELTAALRTADTEVERLKGALKDAADQVAASDIDEANAIIDLDQTKARVRELLASMRAALASGDHATVAMNIGQIAAHVDGEVNAR